MWLFRGSLESEKYNGNLEVIRQLEKTIDYLEVIDL